MIENPNKKLKTKVHDSPEVKHDTFSILEKY